MAQRSTSTTHEKPVKFQFGHFHDLDMPTLENGAETRTPIQGSRPRQQKVNFRGEIWRASMGAEPMAITRFSYQQSSMAFCE